MVAIVITTKNKSQFLIRQLNYYADVHCPYTIYIGDSSGNEHSNNILNALERLKGKLKIVYRNYPDTYFNKSKFKGLAFQKELMGLVVEKYCAYVGDDDFLIPNSLSKCAVFLENHPEYRSVHGKGVFFEYALEVNGIVPYLSCGEYESLKEAENECAVQRLLEFLNNYWVTVFSLHRTEEFLEDYQDIELLSDMSFIEIMANCLTIIGGKSKKFDCLHVVRQNHASRTSKKGRTLLDWIETPDWQPSYENFRRTVGRVLAAKMEIDESESSKIVKKAFSQYLLNIALRGESFKKDLFRVKLRNMTTPAMRKIYRNWRSRAPFIREPMKLEALLLSSSPYHEDFLPIFELIKNLPNSDDIFGEIVMRE